MENAFSFSINGRFITIEGDGGPEMSDLATAIFILANEQGRIDDKPILKTKGFVNHVPLLTKLVNCVDPTVGFWVTMEFNTDKGKYTVESTNAEDRDNFPLHAEFD